MSLNLALMLREAARSHPEKPALLFDGGQVAHAELDAASDRFAAGLQTRGLRPGDAVGLQLPNVPSSSWPTSASSRPAASTSR